MNTSSSYHPDIELLRQYCEGQLSSGLTVMVSTHLSLCSSCREESAAIESDLADQWLNSEVSEPFGESNDSWQQLAEQISAEPQKSAPVSSLDPLLLPACGETVSLPTPLARLAQGKLNWKKLPGGINQASVDLDRKLQCDFIYMESGGQTPPHRHKGTEFTLVLDGSFEDDLGSYGPGDFLLRDGSHTHSPLSKDGCLCFAVLDKPLRFTAGAARFLNPWNQLRFSMKHGLSA